jgi:hypothetical protein
VHEINIQYIIVVQLYLNLLKSGQVGFRVDWSRIISDFESGQISGSLILGYLRFRVIQVRIRSDQVGLGHFNLKLSQISSRLMSDSNRMYFSDMVRFLPLYLPDPEKLGATL